MKIQKHHKLLVPVSGRTSVNIRALTYAEDAELVKKATKKDEQGEEQVDPQSLIDLRSCAMTGLSLEDLLALSQPDINTIEHWNHTFSTQDSESVASLLDFRNWTVGDEMIPKLLQPIKERNSYQLKYPTGRVTRAMQVQKTDDERTFTISIGCTDLEHDELYQLSTPDWTYMQNRLSDFLSQQADYFRQPTSSE
ncbi:hypothetical protein M9194_19795 [Vibrio sp. S4M6]|uniref:hypothetical protein n=1 Tax=Vibrio sinus TaxID=2946865 RepID=UPI00202A56EF|nr:hypothetical protein [Vibrio sinus]MCL9783672.1 hypothetical protein [Vibrio sinus]